MGSLYIEWNVELILNVVSAAGVAAEVIVGARVGRMCYALFVAAALYRRDGRPSSAMPSHAIWRKSLVVTAGGRRAAGRAGVSPRVARVTSHSHLLYANAI